MLLGAPDARSKNRSFRGEKQRPFSGNGFFVSDQIWRRSFCDIRDVWYNLNPCRCWASVWKPISEAAYSAMWWCGKGLLRISLSSLISCLSKKSARSYTSTQMFTADLRRHYYLERVLLVMNCSCFHVANARLRTCIIPRLPFEIGRCFFIQSMLVHTWSYSHVRRYGSWAKKPFVWFPWKRSTTLSS